MDQHGHEDAPLHEIVRHLPFTRLVVTSFVATALIAAGFVAFIVPGFVLLVLWSILGPLIVIEDLRVFPALRRSARLVWPHFLLALVVVAIPTLLEDVPLSMLERFSWYEQPLVRVPVDVLATLVLGGIIGVIEVTLAHALIADEKRRRGGDGDGLEEPGSPSDGSSRKMESAAESRAPAANPTVSREGP